MPALFNITQDMLAAYEQLVDTDGEISTDNQHALESLLLVESEKLESYYFLIRKAESEASAATAMAEQFKRQAECRSNLAARLKTAVMLHLQTTGQPKAVTDSGLTFAVQKNGGRKPLLVNENALEVAPPEFVKMVPTLDRDAVRTALESGKELPFAAIGEAGFHLRLK